MSPRLMLKVNCPSKNPLRLHSIDEQLVFLRSCPWGEKSMKSALVELSHMYVQALAENEDVSSLSSSENKSNKSKHEEENEKNSNPETITFISETFRSYMGLQKKVTTAAADVVKETVKETFREQIQDLHLLDDIKKGQFKNVPSALSGVVAKTSTVLSTKAVKTVLKVKTGITDEVDKIKLKTKAK